MESEERFWTWVKIVATGASLWAIGIVFSRQNLEKPSTSTVGICTVAALSTPLVFAQFSRAIGALLRSDARLERQRLTPKETDKKDTRHAPDANL